MRLTVAVAFLLTTVLCLVNVNAFQQATPTNTASMNVSVSDSAALALSGSNGNFVSRVGTTDNGIMWIDFRKGYGGSVFQLRAPDGGTPQVGGDDMEMKGVFTVTNNDSICQDLSVYVSGTAPSTLSAIRGRGDNGIGSQITFWDKTNGPSSSRVQLGTSGSARQAAIDFHWIATEVISEGTFQVVVSATRSASCP
jgi:hypothetical protein